ncbi:hypothetical protein ACIA8C_21660 [Nocardia sp. NPDC051321]|uniref:hypothetical protein n=1 Tax=Nocardia sp. NPDC051321 TaxID=3364323 RepID=UPI003798EF55
MSFDQLMQHAHDIVEKAAALEAKEAHEHGSGKASGEFPALQQPSLDFVVPMFEPFSSMPDPAHYDPLIADLSAAMGRLNSGSAPRTKLTDDVIWSNPDLDKMTTDGGYLSGWTGDSAMAFKANFIDTFKTL